MVNWGGGHPGVGCAGRGPNTPAGCTVPPKGPGHFYPYYTQAKVGGVCVWEFGNMRNGNRFGGDKQYAHLVPHGFFKGQFDFASAPCPTRIAELGRAGPEPPLRPGPTGSR